MSGPRTPNAVWSSWFDAVEADQHDEREQRLAAAHLVEEPARRARHVTREAPDREQHLAAAVAAAARLIVAAPRSRRRSALGRGVGHRAAAIGAAVTARLDERVGEQARDADAACGARTSAARRRGRRRTSRRGRRARAAARAAGRRRSRGTPTRDGRKYCTPYTKTAPSTAPEIDPSPPTTTIAKIRRLTSGVNVWLTSSCCCEHEQRAGDAGEEARRSRTRASSALRARIAYASAARSLSRTPMSTRPVRLARSPRTADIASASTTIVST